MQAVLVLLEPVRSAEPPIMVSTSGVMTSSASWLDLRVAHFGASAESCFL